MLGDVLLARFERLGQLTDGRRTRSQMVEEPDAHRLPEDTEPLRDELDEHRGQRMRRDRSGSHTRTLLYSCIDVSYRTGISCSATRQSFPDGGGGTSPFSETPCRGFVGHHARRPSSWTAAGSSTGRTNRASSRMEMARPTVSRRLNRPLIANGTIAATITTAAPVAAPAVSRRPCASASCERPLRTNSSRVR